MRWCTASATLALEKPTVQDCLPPQHPFASKWRGSPQSSASQLPPGLLMALGDWRPAGLEVARSGSDAVGRLWCRRQELYLVGTGRRCSPGWGASEQQFRVHPLLPTNLPFPNSCFGVTWAFVICYPWLDRRLLELASAWFQSCASVELGRGAHPVAMNGKTGQSWLGLASWAGYSHGLLESSPPGTAPFGHTALAQAPVSPGALS